MASADRPRDSRHASTSPAARHRVVVFAIAACVVVIAATVFWRQRAAPSTPAAQTVRRLVLVTVDTLRADRVGVYGWPAARTPAMDGIAARGVRFDRAFAPAPITLPSHASLLSGLYPPGHGSRHNGMRIRGDVPTLATVLKAQGWATAAFVGAFPLDRRFGLDAGFDRYGDRMPRGPNGRPLNERPGQVVVDEALAWMNGVGEQPFFLWVHLFEPHAPYEPDPVRGPAGWKLPASQRYDDEVARADQQIGRLLSVVGSRQASTLVIIAGDHGEAFGEHGELTHSLFLYDTTLRVPLLMAGPGVPANGRAIAANVSLVDVFPTVVELLGSRSRDVDGTSLVPAMRGGTIPDRELYAETFAPLLDFGWASLRAVRAGSFKFIAAPRPELYDVISDPGEERDLSSTRADQAIAMAERVTRYAGPELPQQQGGVSADPEARARLSALGYTSGSARSQQAGARPDPKDRRDVAARLARVASGELTGKDLRTALETIVAQDAGNGQAQMRLGYVLLEAGDLAGAEPRFRKAIGASVPSADPYLGLALCLVSTNRSREAARVLEVSRQVEPDNPVVEANLGQLALDASQLDSAVALLTRAVSLDPDLHQARFALARALARAGRRIEAAGQARELLHRLPANAPQRPEVDRLLQTVK